MGPMVTEKQSSIRYKPQGEKSFAKSDVANCSVSRYNNERWKTSPPARERVKSLNVPTTASLHSTYASTIVIEEGTYFS